jgi:hypothetical protein
MEPDILIGGKGDGGEYPPPIENTRGRSEMLAQQ